MSDVTSFEVTGDWRHIVDDGMVDEDNLPDEVPLTGKVVFRPVYPTVATAGVPVTAYTLGPVTALVAGGVLTDLQGRPGIKLAGQVGDHTVRWSAETSLRYMGQNVDYPRVTFDLTEDVRLTGIITQAGPSLSPIVVDPRIEALAASVENVNLAVIAAEGHALDAAQAITLAGAEADRAIGLATAQDQAVADTVVAGGPTTTALNATYDPKRDDIVRPVQFGAVGDGVADDTAAFQACINACPVDGIVDGQGLTYKVGGLSYKNNMRCLNAKLITRDSGTHWDCPVLIDGRTVPKKNLSFWKWLVDGNRQGQTNLGVPADGARSAWMILGRVENLLIEDCEGNNAATDGLMFFSNTTEVNRTPGVPLMRHIRVLRSKFNGNRRHGASGDSMWDAVAEDCQFNGNGLAVEGTAQGATQYLFSGSPFGSGWDQEEYWSGAMTPDSMTWTRCEMLGNARMGLLVDARTLDQKAQTYVTKGPYRVLGGVYDNGVGSGNSCIEVTPAASVVTDTDTKRHFNVVEIIDVECHGYPVVRSVEEYLFRGREPRTLGAVSGAAYSVDKAVVSIASRTKPYAFSGAVPIYGDEPKAQFIPASAFFPVEGAPVAGAHAGRACWKFAPGIDTSVTTTVAPPSGWSSYKIESHVAFPVETTGTTTVSGREGSATSLAGAMAAGNKGITAASPAGEAQKAEHFPSRACTPGPRAIQIGRFAWQNTVADDMIFLGVTITKTR